ncbi:RES family NAD+ phosphorylase [Luteithermobacter gelatinilyticus]|uniref:RES family NAD+ phosphorylase n=1 Tax=Luteithermobacter gelatinilyticus TaxID=2582913 RepID=UPI001105F9F2|nr:RES family NAD+ phosphorylase [Luteithermobacter gelatinilyticus]
MWTAGALSSEARSYSHDIWRFVEFQYKTATMRLVDHDPGDQAVLEDILEDSKPAIPAGAEGLHFLLFTPFRYQAYPTGSRFRRVGDLRGVYYASETVETALAEAAWHTRLFFQESPETLLPQQPLLKTAFPVLCRTDRFLNLTLPPLDRDRALWTSAEEYGACQDLADQARLAQMEAIGYESVRDAGGGLNVAALSPEIFRGRRIDSQRSMTWHLLVHATGVEAWCDLPTLRVSFEFP